MFDWLKQLLGIRRHIRRNNSELTDEIIREELAGVLSSTLGISRADAYRRCYVEIAKEHDVHYLSVTYNNVKVKTYISNASLEWSLIDFSFIYLRPMAMMIANKLQRTVPAQ